MWPWVSMTEKERSPISTVSPSSRKRSGSGGLRKPGIMDAESGGLFDHVGVVLMDGKGGVGRIDHIGHCADVVFVAVGGEEIFDG